VTLLSNQYDRRVTTTLDFYKTYTEKVRPEYLDFGKRWDSYSSQNKPEFFKLKREDMKKFVISFFKNDQNAKNDLESMIDFFDTLAICVQRRSCDRNTMLDLLGNQIEHVFTVSAYYIFQQREEDRDPNIGKGLNELYRMDREPLIWTVL
jgi:hypothetical protein